MRWPSDPVEWAAVGCAVLVAMAFTLTFGLIGLYTLLSPPNS